MEKIKQIVYKTVKEYFEPIFYKEFWYGVFAFWAIAWVVIYHAN